MLAKALKLHPVALGRSLGLPHFRRHPLLRAEPSQVQLVAPSRVAICLCWRSISIKRQASRAGRKRALGGVFTRRAPELDRPQTELESTRLRSTGSHQILAYLYADEPIYWPFALPADKLKTLRAARCGIM